MNVVQKIKKHTFPNIWMLSIILIIPIFLISISSVLHRQEYQIIEKEYLKEEDTVIIKGQEGYTGRFPDFISTKKGLIAAYYWNNTHAPYKIGDSLGTIQLMFGNKDGTAWEFKPMNFIDKDFLIQNGLGVWTDGTCFYYSQSEAETNNAEFCIEARDPNFAKMGERIFFTFFTRLPWNCELGGHNYYQYDESYDYTYGRTYIMYSDDQGISWSSPVEIQCDFLDEGAAKRGNIATLGNDGLLIPLYGYSSKLPTTFTTSNIRATIRDDVWSFEEYSSHLDKDGAIVLGSFEPGVTEVSFAAVGDYVYAVCRANGDVLVSEDEGRTWISLDPAKPQGFTLHQPSLEAISETKQLLASWAEPNSNGGRDIYLYLFKPGKENWNYSSKYCVYHNPFPGDMADPTSIFITDLNHSRILIIYYDAQKEIVGCKRVELTKKYK